MGNYTISIGEGTKIEMEEMYLHSIGLLYSALHTTSDLK